MRPLFLLLVFLSSIASGNITTRLDPQKAVKLQKGDVCRYFRVSGGHGGKRLYQSLVVVRADHTVICKATDFESSFKMNAEQIKSWNNSVANFDPKRMFVTKRKEKTLPSAAPGGVDYYLTLKIGKKTYAGDNVKWDMGYVFVIDNLEVFFYLERPKKS
jgi:hypothetical protein